MTMVFLEDSASKIYYAMFYMVQAFGLVLVVCLLAAQAVFTEGKYQNKIRHQAAIKTLRVKYDAKSEGPGLQIPGRRRHGGKMQKNLEMGGTKLRGLCDTV